MKKFNKDCQLHFYTSDDNYEVVLEYRETFESLNFTIQDYLALYKAYNLYVHLKDEIVKNMCEDIINYLMMKTI